MFEIEGKQENRRQLLPAKAQTAYAVGEIVYVSSSVAEKVPAGSSSQLAHTNIFLVMAPCDNSLGAGAALNVEVCACDSRQALKADTTAAPTIEDVGTIKQFDGSLTVDDANAAGAKMMGFEIQDYDATNLKVYGKIAVYVA